MSTIPFFKLLATFTLAAVAFVAPSAQAATTELSDFARKPNGDVRTMNRYSAIRYCTSESLRLPTARELAQWSASMGAAGISDTAKPGYYEVLAQNPNGEVDHFYFSNKGFRIPDIETEYNWLWSSSRVSTHPFFGYALNGDTGALLADDLGNPNNAARCLP